MAEEMTDLDYCVAGVIWRDGPVSAYRVRERFRRSMTTVWSSSCGTIYPVIDRLVGEGSVSATEPLNGRGTRLLNITERGQGRVTDWMLKLEPQVAAPVPDPIRTRLQYLSVLPQDAADRFITEAINLTEEALERVVESLPVRAESDWIDFLAALGSAQQLEGRLRWLSAIKPAMLDRSEDRVQRLLAPFRS